MEDNPLFAFEQSVHGSPTGSSASFTASFNGGAAPPPHPTPPSAAALMMVNIKSHVPVVLDIVNPNYQEWRCFLDSIIGKFGLLPHIQAAPTAAQLADPEWVMKDQCLVNWLFNTMTRDVMRIVRVPGGNAAAFTIWNAIVDQFRDHQLHRAVYLESEYRSLYQGDLNVTDYTAKLKELADALGDLGQPVSDQSQVLNMLRGLNDKYRHCIATITSRQPPHTFLSARSFLLLEELYATEHGKMATQHAMLAQGARVQSPRPAHPSPTPASAGQQHGGSGSPSGGNRNRRRGRGKGTGNVVPANGPANPSTGSNGGPSPTPRPTSFPNTLWAAAYNPWQGMVQAWPMPFRPPTAGVLGPRPGTPPQQAFYAGPYDAQSMQSVPAPVDPNAMLAALANAGVPQAGTSNSDWFLDTGASSHMTSGTGNLHHIRPLIPSSSVTVGNGTRMPITHLARSSVPTSTTPLSLNNVLITPSLVKNLISVRSLTRDNNVSVEFDPHGFSIKDLQTQQVKLRCDSRGDLYPLRPPQHLALHASASADLWHQRLGHPGHDQMAAALRNFNFTCTKSSAHVCTACQLGMIE